MAHQKPESYDHVLRCQKVKNGYFNIFFFCTFTMALIYINFDILKYIKKSNISKLV